MGEGNHSWSAYQEGSCLTDANMQVIMEVETDHLVEEVFKVRGRGSPLRMRFKGGAPCGCGARGVLQQ